MAHIIIRDIVKTFDSVRVIDNINIEIERGELFFLLGPSGCGKTTLLRTIAGFYRPDQGQIRINEKDVTDVPPHKRNTGMVFQSYALWPHLTVRENLAFGLELHKIPAAERRRRVDDVLEMIQLSKLADRSPNQLSGGQQQRVALGRALVLEPEVVLLDEPLSNLDAKLRLEMREQIKALHDRLGLTMIYVTHDQSEALSMADRIAIMQNGRIQQSGTPRDIYNFPANPFIAEFIGETNLIPGSVKRIAAEISVSTEIGELQSSLPYDGIKPADPVFCSIRPERLTVIGKNESYVNRIEGQVTRIIYLGSHEQYFLTLADKSQLKVIEYSLQSAKTESGKKAQIGCHAQDVVLLRREAP
ncbi:ABC transporter ATP-binding protein [candidate division KSB1 bacterium]|nr:ABC transporter ATP-binding protein [candidate division KSB1 bacterium]